MIDDAKNPGAAARTPTMAKTPSNGQAIVHTTIPDECVYLRKRAGPRRLFHMVSLIVASRLLTMMTASAQPCPRAIHGKS